MQRGDQSAASSHEVRVDFAGCGGGLVVLQPGDSLEFGRNTGTGQITAKDMSVSGQHGRITAGPGRWAAESLGSRYAFTIFDNHSPSRLALPLLAGPVEVPFASSTVVVEIARRRHVFSVVCEGQVGWATGWTPLLDTLRSDDTLSTRVARAHQQLRISTKSGRTLRWFEVLTAICESRIDCPYAPTVPTRAEVADRVQISVKHLDETYVPEIERYLGIERSRFRSFEQFAEAVATVAIGQRIVVPSDVDDLCDLRGPRPT